MFAFYATLVIIAQKNPFVYIFFNIYRRSGLFCLLFVRKTDKNPHAAPFFRFLTLSKALSSVFARIDEGKRLRPNSQRGCAKMHSPFGNFEKFKSTDG